MSEDDERGKIRAQVVAIYIASAFCCLVPVLLYVGEIYCKLNNIAPPDQDLMLKCCLTGVGAIITFGFPGIPGAFVGIFKKLFEKGGGNAK